MHAAKLALATAALTGLAMPALSAEHEVAQFSVAEHEEVGAYLVGPNDQPVYGFISLTGKGTDGLPPLESCGEGCREDWPLVTVTETPKGGPGLDATLFETVPDGDVLVAVYNAWPLFYFAQEDGVGAPDGHAVHTYGGWWALVRPDGTLLRTGIMPGAND